MAFEVKINATQVAGLAARLAEITPEALGRATVAGLNEATEQAYTDARVKMIAGINLTDEYLRDRMTLTPAKDAASAIPIASVRASGALTNLISYKPRQNSVVVRFPNSVVAPLIKKLGPNPRKAGSLLPWKLRVGDKARGIAVDRKQAGLTVEVARGAPKPISYAFIIRGSGGRLFVGARKAGDHKGKGKVHALTGPSVYQLFRHALDPKFLQGVQDNLSNSVIHGIDAEIKKALA